MWIHEMLRLFFTIFLLVSSDCLSQMTEEASSTGYFVKMNNTLNIRFDLDNDVRSFEYEGIDDNYAIKPNTRLRMAVAVNYRFISLKIGFSPKFLAEHDSDLKGETKVFRLSLDIFMNNWYQNIDYNQVKGYYVEGFGDPTNSILGSNEEFIILPDLKTLSITGTTFYRFNENYSFKAVINQNEIQSKSAGSFIPSLRYGYFEITNKTTPQDIKTFFTILNAGYYHTFVLHKNWYSNLGLAPGLGIEFNKLLTRTDEGEIITRANNVAFNISTQLGIGYNSNRFYGGTALIGSATSRNEKSIIRFNSVRGYFKIFVGYRFNPPKSFDRGMDWLEDKNPL